MARLYRRQPDSSHLETPRVFVRVLCEPGTLVDTVRPYEDLTSLSLDMDMDIPEAGLHVMAVGPFLILELERSKHALAADTSVTVLIADLDRAVARAVARGAEVIEARWQSPV